MTRNISGWDIGGAHVKVARCSPQGELLQVIQVPCPLWQGIEQLEHAIDSIFNTLDNKYDIAAITMTGELVDIFADRQSGVEEILRCMSNHIDVDNTLVYGAEAGWLTPNQARQQWHQVASRNWQASADLVVQAIPNGLLIDMGSTTCDIIPLINGQALPTGVDDLGRQTSRELLYTGAIRTPLIALSQTAPFNGTLVSLAAEVFASTGDIWCLLNKLDPDTTQDNSADGQSWQRASCARRIARLLGTDSTEAEPEQWRQLALWFAEQQCHQISNAILHVLSAHSSLAPTAPIIGAGVGRFIIKICAQRLNRPYQDFHDVISSSDDLASDHAPAVAVALLAQQKLS
ncbi:MAG: H4MPT-linked C1 transfer pathway protein [Methylophaga sp.]|nr:H4MPT-linked C1 transfer pathway protein [Methylophaga sp.]